MRSAIARLKLAGVADDIFLRPLREYTSPVVADVVRTFGESLPKGLELESTANCLSSGHEEACYCTVKATAPTVALTEPDLPVTVIV